MSGYGTASASCRLTNKIQTLLVSKWPNQPELKAREDGLDEVTITVLKCHPNERWALVQLRGGATLVAIPYLTGGRLSGGRIPRTNHNMVVLVPPSRLETFQVLTERPSTTKK
jgi:hypothetical protein